MIKITNGSMVIGVSQGAYENYYKPQGFHPIEKPLVAEAIEDPNTPENIVPLNSDFKDSNEDEDDDDLFEEDESTEEGNLADIPLSEMSKEQLMELAKAEGINLDDAGDSKKRMRAIIKAARG